MSDIFSGKASWDKYFGMPYPPLEVFSWDFLSCSIHCIQEGHLVMWTMVKKPRFPLLGGLSPYIKTVIFPVTQHN